MRILLLNQFYPPDVAPTGQMAHDLARVLVARGHEVHAACSRRSYDGGKMFPATECRDGVRIHRIPAFGFGRAGFLGKLADYASYYGLLAAKLFLDLPRPDVILALTTPPYVGLLACLAARGRGARHMHWVMDLYPDVMAAHGMLRKGRGLYSVFEALARGQWRSSPMLLALGPHMEARVRSYAGGRTRCAWVPLWAPDGLVPWTSGEPNPLRKARGWSDDEMVILYSGNMGLGHRFAEFLEAARRLGRAGPRWAFVGGGKRRFEIEEYARTHAEARIELHPYVPDADLRRNLCSADVHLASLDGAWQGLMVPSKIQGIFAVGRPVIFVGRRCNEIAEWIEEAGAGWVIGEGDVDGLLRAVEEARDPVERARRGDAAFRYAQDHFDRHANATRLAELVETARPGM